MADCDSIIMPVSEIKCIRISIEAWLKPPYVVYWTESGTEIGSILSKYKIKWRFNNE